MSKDQTIKEGLLYKRGKINTDWKQRLFILNGKQLAYFKGSVSKLAILSQAFDYLNTAETLSIRCN